MFSIQKKLPHSLGRAGTLTTPHGVIHTPAFVTVGTKASVKALTPDQIKSTGAQVVLGNPYHLYLEPGETIVKQGGGLGRFMGWSGPTMTDSGGFQVFSLGSAFGEKISKVSKSHFAIRTNKGLVGEVEERRETLAKIDEDGVTFKSYKDGSEHRFTPERSIEIQHAIGADIIFAFDECTSPEASYEYQKQAMERTHRWAKRSLERHRELRAQSRKAKVNAENSLPQAIFGIVQGGRFEDLRKESARFLAALRLPISGPAPREQSDFAGFDGFGIGGSFDKEDMGNAVRWVNELLPEEKPRHLLGIGDPLDLFGAVENGCDLFDCVAPTREARTGSLYTRHGRFNIRNARYKTDFTPIESECGCYTCRPSESGGAGATRAYLSHLFRSGEILGSTLATIHNVYFIVNLVKEMRQGILEERFDRMKVLYYSQYR